MWRAISMIRSTYATRASMHQLDGARGFRGRAFRITEPQRVNTPQRRTTSFASVTTRNSMILSVYPDAHDVEVLLGCCWCCSWICLSALRETVQLCWYICVGENTIPPYAFCNCSIGKKPATTSRSSQQLEMGLHDRPRVENRNIIW